MHVYSKRHPDRGVFIAKPKNVFVENHLYTLVNADGTKDVSLEEVFFRSLDTNACSVLAEIVCSARQGALPDLSPDERKIWWESFCYQILRVPDTREQFQKGIYQKIASATEFMLRIQSGADRLLKTQKTEKAFEELENNSSFEKAATKLGEVIESISEERICIYVIRNAKPRRGFVIGSKPVLKPQLLNWPHLGVQTVEPLLTIARDVAVTPYPGKSDMVLPINDKRIRSINRSMFKQSSVIAGCSHELIGSLVGEIDRTSAL